MAFTFFFFFFFFFFIYITLHQSLITRENEVTSAEIVKTLKWDTLQTRRTTSRLTMLYKETHGEVTLPTHYLQIVDACTRLGTNNLMQKNKSALLNSIYSSEPSETGLSYPWTSRQHLLLQLSRPGCIFNFQLSAHMPPTPLPWSDNIYVCTTIYVQIQSRHISCMILYQVRKELCKIIDLVHLTVGPSGNKISASQTHFIIGPHICPHRLELRQVLNFCVAHLPV